MAKSEGIAEVQVHPFTTVGGQRVFVYRCRDSVTQRPLVSLLFSVETGDHMVMQVNARAAVLDLLRQQGYRTARYVPLEPLPPGTLVSLN